MRLLTRSNLFHLGHKATWYNAELHKPSFGEVQRVTLISGIGIGPEITSKHDVMQSVCWMYSKPLTSPWNSMWSRISPLRMGRRENFSRKTSAFFLVWWFLKKEWIPSTTTITSSTNIWISMLMSIFAIPSLQSVIVTTMLTLQSSGKTLRESFQELSIRSIPE